MILSKRTTDWRDSYCKVISGFPYYSPNTTCRYSRWNVWHVSLGISTRLLDTYNKQKPFWHDCATFCFQQPKNRSIIASCGLNVATIACWQVLNYLAVCCKAVTFAHLALFRSAWWWRSRGRCWTSTSRSLWLRRLTGSLTHLILYYSTVRRYG